MEEFQYSVIITKKGEQIPLQCPPGIQITIHNPADPVVNEVPIDINSDQFKDVQKMAETNDIGDDILNSKDNNAS